MTTHSSSPQDELRTEALVQEVRKQLKRQEPRSSPTEPSAAAEHSSQDSPQSLAQLRQLVQELQSRWVITPQPFSSQFPFLEKVLGPFWSLWNSIVARWYLPTYLQQQIDFNASVVRMAYHVEQLLNMLTSERYHVQDDTAEYDRAIVESARRLAQVDVLLQKMAADLALLQRQVDQGPLATLEDRMTRLEGMLQIPGQVPARGVQDEAQQRAVSLPGLDYFAFEQRFRGSHDEVKARQRPYVDHFRGLGPVVDLGCGRGEFLELLRETGISGKGVDSDPGMVAYCQQRGLEVVLGDLFEFLATEENGAVGGTYSAQVIEHLSPSKLVDLLHLSYQKLAPGGVLLAETINPMCLLALASHYTIDLSHQQPVHPETAAFLLESAGFTDIHVRYVSPVPELGRLQPVAPHPEQGLERWHEVLNDNVRKLNDLLFTYQEYAIIGRKPT